MRVAQFLAPVAVFAVVAYSLENSHVKRAPLGKLGCSTPSSRLTEPAAPPQTEEFASASQDPLSRSPEVARSRNLLPRGRSPSPFESDHHAPKGEYVTYKTGGWGRPTLEFMAWLKADRERKIAYVTVENRMSTLHSQLVWRDHRATTDFAKFRTLSRTYRARWPVPLRALRGAPQPPEETVLRDLWETTLPEEGEVTREAREQLLRLPDERGRKLPLRSVMKNGEKMVGGALDRHVLSHADHDWEKERGSTEVTSNEQARARLGEKSSGGELSFFDRKWSRRPYDENQRRDGGGGAPFSYRVWKDPQPPASQAMGAPVQRPRESRGEAAPSSTSQWRAVPVDDPQAPAWARAWADFRRQQETRPELKNSP